MGFICYLFKFILKYNSIVNNKKLYDTLIKQFIEIGRIETIPSIPDSEFSYLREGKWQRARYPKNCDDYSIYDLKLLYKGLVLCEKHFKWQVGSATNTAWMLRNIVERLDTKSDYDEIKGLYEFGFANRGHNDYVPTGSGIHNACITFEDYLEINHQKAINIAKHDALMQKQKENSKRINAIKSEFKKKRMFDRAELKKKIDKNITVIEY